MSGASSGTHGLHIIFASETGDPQLLQEIFPRCANPNCNRLLRGAIVSRNGVMYHEHCAGAGK